MEKFDVVVAGCGVAGLMLARKLSELGLRALLVESGEVVANGPSTRNEGWLHRGTYHAVSIRDRASAIRVARRCIYGHEQVKAFAPEAIEEPHGAAYALVRDAARADEARSRWLEAGVSFAEVSTSEVARVAPGADLSRVAAAFRVEDKSVDTRLLYRKLLAVSESRGAKLLLGHTARPLPDGALDVRGPSGERVAVDAPICIHTVGYGASTAFGASLPLRYWKSHLLVVARVCEPGLFFLDPGEAAMMHHGGASIVGLNEDATRCEGPSFDVEPEGARRLADALRRLHPRLRSNDVKEVACTKIDLAEDARGSRSLDISVGEPIPGHICVFPGKMTEAPYVADHVARIVATRIGLGRIATRPCDSFLEGVAA